MGWIAAILKLNWSTMVVNKKAFWSLTVLMAVQNLIYFALWVIVFSKISSMRGWGLREVAFLYGAGALGYGILFTIFGGLNQLGHMIHDGSLDSCLARPRPVLLLALMQRMRADSLGDVVCGALMLAIWVRPEMKDLALITVLSISAGLVYFAFRLIMHALAFWGLGGEASENGFIAFLIASTNPQKGFSVWGKIVLLSIFPAGYIGLLPVEILRSFRWDFFAWQIAASLAVFGFAVWLFHLGLRRYASGNQFIMLR